WGWAGRRVGSRSRVLPAVVVLERDRAGHTPPLDLLGGPGHRLVVRGVSRHLDRRRPDVDLVVAATRVGPARLNPEFRGVALAEVVADAVGQEAKHSRPDDS